MKSTILSKTSCIATSFAFFAAQLITSGDAKAQTDQSRLNAAIYELEFMEDDTGKVNSLYSISFNFRTINPDSGILMGKKALSLSIMLNWEKGIAISYHTIASNYMAKSDYREATKYLVDAMFINSDAGNHAALSMNYINLGICYYNSGEYAKSLEFYFKAGNIARDLKDSFNLAKCNNGIGNTYVAIDSAAAAIRYFNEAIRYYSLKKDSQNLARSYHNLGTAYESQKRFFLARQLYLLALGINTRYNIRPEIIKDLGSIANTYRGNTDSALYYYSKALELAEQYNVDISLIGVNLANMVQLYIDIFTNPQKEVKNKPSLAKLEDYCTRAIEIFTEIKNIDHLQQALDVRSKVRVLMGNYKDALNDRVECDRLKDSIFNDARQRVESIEKKYQQLDAEKKASEIHHRHLMTKLAIAAAVSVAVGILFLIMKMQSVFRYGISFIKRYWFFNFLLISGFVSMLLEPAIPVWFSHNPWLIWLTYICIPFILEQLYHIVAKQLTEWNKNKEEKQAQSLKNGSSNKIEAEKNGPEPRIKTIRSPRRKNEPLT